MTLAETLRASQHWAATTASLNEVAVVRDVTGTVVEPNYGESHEYSVRLRLLDDRLGLTAVQQRRAHAISLHRRSTRAIAASPEGKSIARAGTCASASDWVMRFSWVLRPSR